MTTQTHNLKESSKKVPVHSVRVDLTPVNLPKVVFGPEPCERKASERKVMHRVEGRDAGLVERERKIKCSG